MVLLAAVVVGARASAGTSWCVACSSWLSSPCGCHPFGASSRSGGFLLLQVNYAISLGLGAHGAPAPACRTWCWPCWGLAILGFNEQISLVLYDPASNAFPLVGGALFSTYYSVDGAFDVVVAYPLMPWAGHDDAWAGCGGRRRLVVLRGGGAALTGAGPGRVRPGGRWRSLPCCAA